VSAPPCIAASRGCAAAGRQRLDKDRYVPARQMWAANTRPAAADHRLVPATGPPAAAAKRCSLCKVLLRERDPTGR